MTLLIISPDYASHLLPLASIGTAWRDAGERVVVATGPATDGIVREFGFERVNLQLGKGSNPGVIRAEDQPAGEDDALRGFFDATRRGMVETLEFQARQRLSDLMWEPVQQARATIRIVDELRPDHVIVDHLAFSARVGLVAARVRHADVVLGHPSALPVGDEIYGLPARWPARFSPDADAIARLREVCLRVSANFTTEWNAALLELDPAAQPSPSAFAEHGDVLLYNYPEFLASPGRPLPPHAFLGSALRDEPADADVEEWLAAGDEPVVYVSFGSFLSVRDDVLARVARAIEPLGVRAAIALGSGSRDVLGPVPDGWLVREYLPQVRLLAHAAAAVTHGGNNSVTEAMASGVPLLVLPFSTDQFEGAAAIERAAVGVALAPNDSTVDELRAAIERVLRLEVPQPTGPQGRDAAYAALTASV